MVIKKIQINGFGNLEKKEIEWGNGINVVYGKNEAGKSTLAQFIKCIFYGVNKNKAGKDFSEYELHKPWGNGDFSGKIEYEWDDKRYTVFRDFTKNNAKIYDEDGTDITAEFPKDKARGSEVGLAHFGVDEETFENTLFVSQKEAEVDLPSQKNIIQKLTNILQSGGESLSYEKIESKLQKKLTEEIGTERTHNKPINIVKKEIADKEQTRDRLLNHREKSSSLEARLKDITEQEQKTECSIEQTNLILETKEKYASLLAEKERTFELTKKIKEKERQEKIENNRKQFQHAIVLLVVITILCAVALGIFRAFWWIAVEVLLAILGGVAVSISNRLDLPEEDNTDFDVTKEELNKKEIKELEKLRQKGIKDTYLERKIPDLKTLLAGLEKKKTDLLLEQHKIHIEQESLKESMERLTDVEEQLVQYKEEKDSLERKAKIIHLALQKLEESYEELKSEVIPELQKHIQEKIADTTNGKYKKAIYHNEEGLLAENELGEMIPVSKLSVGTMDQMYLGFRLGLSQKMGQLPLVLDETFAYYDQERLTNVLKCLARMHQQIIIFTCSQREKEILEHLEIPFEWINIE